MNLILPLFIAATIPLRNPFWPIGYIGEREAISDKPKIEVKTTAESANEEDTKTAVNAESIAAAEEADDNQCGNRLWIQARKALKIGGTMRTKDKEGSHQSVMINGKIYADGDLISMNLDGKRYTWKVKNLTEGGTLKLQRIKCRDLEEADDNEGE